MKIIKANYLEHSLGVDYYRYRIQYADGAHWYSVGMSEECADQLAALLNVQIITCRPYRREDLLGI